MKDDHIERLQDSVGELEHKVERLERKLENIRQAGAHLQGAVDEYEAARAERINALINGTYDSTAGSDKKAEVTGVLLAMVSMTLSAIGRV